MTLSSSPRRARPQRPWWVVGLLSLLLLAGFVLRVWHIDYADGQMPHPDERSTVSFYARWIHLPPPGVSWLDARQSPLNPLWDIEREERRQYTYGHFPLYLLVGSANALNQLAPLAERAGASPQVVDTLRSANGAGMAVLGRLWMAIADTGTVLFVFLLAERIYGRRRPWVGLLAAAFSAFSVIQIQLSHFFAVDPISASFTAMALYGALRLVDAPPGRGARWALFTGVGAGLAIASKFSALPILAAPAAAGLLLATRRGDGREGRLGQAVTLTLLAWLMAVATFAVTSPFAILDWKNFSWAVLEQQGAMVRGLADFPFTRQYRGTIPYLYQIEQLVRWGLGWPLGVLAFAALAWVLVKTLLRRARAGELILLSWIAPYFGLTGLFLAKFIRYMVPVTPFLLVFAAGLIAAMASYRPRTVKRAAAPNPQPAIGEQYPVSSVQYSEPEIATPSPPLSHPVTLSPCHRVIRALGAAIAVVALVGAVLWSLAFVNGVYNTTHPWITTSRWVYANIPDGSTIAWEQWDDSLPYDLPEPNASRSRYRFIDWGPFEEDTAEKYERLKSTLRDADVMIYSSNRIYGAVDNLPQRYPMTTRYYQLMAEGKLGYELAIKDVNHPTLFGVSINDEHADESFTLYDHPTVLVYRKVRNLSDAEWDALLGGSWAGAQAHDVGPAPLIQRLWPSGEARRAEPPRAEPQPEGDKTLLLDRPLSELPVVQDFRWNTWASRSPLAAVVVWWLVVAVLGWAAWPLSFVLFRGLHDRGYILSRSLGWLLVGYAVWIAASLRIVEYRTSVIVLAVGGLAVISTLIWRRQRRTMAAFWRLNRRVVLFSEALFAAAYGLFVLFRVANPDIWQPWNGGEKFMEFAFLNAILRSPYFPPIDPYFAGGVINYYYFGHYLVSVLIKLTGIASSVAFNLAIATVFALAVVNVWSVGYTLARRLWPVDRAGQQCEERPAPRRQGALGGLLAAFLVALLGNPDGGAQVVRKVATLSSSAFTSNLPGLQTVWRFGGGLAKVLGPERLPSYSYWDPSRVIPYTINEFPYWSFLFADLHPHMIGIGFTVLLLALLSALFLRAPRALAAPAAGAGARGWLVYLVRLGSGDGLYVALALALGALAVINTWDLPTYFGLAVLVWVLRDWRLGHWQRSRMRMAVRAGLFAAALLATALLLYWPFFSHYRALASSGVGFVADPSPLGKWLGVWATLGFVAASVLLVELRRAPRSLTRSRRDPAGLRWLRLAGDRLEGDGVAVLVQRTLRASTAVGLGIGAALLGVVLLLLAHRNTAALLLLPTLLAFVLLWRRSARPEVQFMLMLLFTGLLVLLGVEFLYLKDHLQGGEWRRMNTLFKFYIQAWVLLGLAGGVALPGVWRSLRARWSWPWRALWGGAFAVLLALSLVFLLVGTPARLDDRFPPRDGLPNRPALGTLDGMAYMQAGVYTWHPDPAQAANTPIELRYDYDALRWMLDNISGMPVVAEAVIGYYREGGLRVASFTGFPTLLGFHEEGEQRYGSQTGERRSKAEEFWNTLDPARARALIDDLGITYIYVGQLERIMVAAEGLAKFEQMTAPTDGTQAALEIVYQNDRVVLYHVLPR